MFKLAAMPTFTHKAFLTALASISPCKVAPLALVSKPTLMYADHCAWTVIGRVCTIVDAPRYCGPSHIDASGPIFGMGSTCLDSHTDLHGDDCAHEYLHWSDARLAAALADTYLPQTYANDMCDCAHCAE